ncbi:autolysin [Clostridium puniceum]|uniref:Autolysin n=1 Tax=Clostridium puniceum TaxID=29367 RepID=A0A1S8TDM4_9CLOT|nr:N-acetylmuramoyl-L-alanine amidase family protein [Clostridium puniceum]OOM75883.1 autolysin [Clostridium puniceum]
MIKRITKITGLLMCIGSIISIVPVHALDYEELDAQEGTIYSATAKGKGIFLDGEINGEEEAIYWISEDGKYNKLDEIDTGATFSDLLLNRYLEIDDGSREYSYVDITNNCNLVDYDVRADLENTEARLLKSKIKHDNDGRFDESSYSGSNKVSAINQVKNKFLSSSNGLAAYKYKLEEPRVNGDDYSTIYANLQGNYVDVDYDLGSLKVSISTTGSAVTIKNTEDTYEIKQDGTIYELKAVIKENKYVTSYSDTIYRLADLTIYKKEKGSNDSTYKPATSELKFGKDGYQVTDGDSVTVLQKFSVTPATDDIDGIKYPKDSTIYFITDKQGNREYLLGHSVANAIKKIGLSKGAGKVKITANEQGLYSMYQDSTERKLYVEKLNLKSKNGFNYIDADDYDSSDVDSIASLNTPGSLPWFINSGYIEAWDGNENFNKLYRIDGSIDSISITSKDNMIAWNQDTGVYSIIHNVTPTSNKNAVGGNTTINTQTTTNAAVKISDTPDGWILNQDNTWNYILENGTKKTGWLNTNSTWYYLNTDGIMSTEWINDNGTWYYLDETGAMKTGWINYNGTWYYCTSSGAMLYDTIIDGYKLGIDGAWIN